MFVLSRVLSNGAEKIGDGKFDYLTEIKSDDEVGRLARALNSMMGRLDRRESDLRKAKDDLQLIANERAAALEIVRAQNEVLKAVQRSQTEFIANPSERFGNLLDKLLKATNSEFGFIDEMTYRGDGQPYLVAKAITDISWDEESRKSYQKFADERGLEFHNIRGLFGTVILTGELVIANDPGTDTRRSLLPEGHPPLHSFLGLPLHSEGKIIGVIGIANRPGGYDKELVEFVQPLVTTCASLLAAYRSEQRRRETERELQQKFAALRQAEDLAQLGYFERNWQDGTGYWSDGFYKLLDLEPGIVPSHEEYENYVHEEDRKRFVEHVRDSLNSRKPMNIEYRMVQESGNVIHVHAICESTYDADGKPVVTRGTLQDITALKMDEERLRESEEKYRRLHETMRDAFVRVDMTGRILETNQAYQEMLGYSAEELRSLTYMDLTPEKWHAVEAVIVQDEILSKGFSGVYEKEYRKKDGTMFPVELRTVLIRDENGEPSSMWGAARDITERKRTEAEIQALNRDLEARVQERTAALEKANSTLREEIVARTRAEESVAANLEATNRLQRIGALFIGESDLQQVLEEVVEAAIALTSADKGNIQIIDPRSNCLKIVAHRGFDQAFLDFWNRVYEGQGSCHNALEAGQRVIVEDITKSPIFVDTPALQAQLAAGVRAVQSTPLIGRSGKVFGMISTHFDSPHWPDDRTLKLLDVLVRQTTDIIERADYEAELKEAVRNLTRSNQDLEQFGYVASHDLQEPLRTVTGALQMFELDHKGKLGEDSDRLINYAVDGAKKMKSLVADLLTYSRIAAGNNEFIEVDTQSILDQSTSNLKNLIDEKKAEITYDKMPKVVGDSTQLLQVFQNLIGNALKFGPAEFPKVHISALQNGGEWVFSVKDNGIGIEEQYFDRIFVVFQQLEKKDSTHGTGIGLSIVKRVIERHQGRIWVESELGVGSTFYFTIPIGIEI